MLRHLAKYEVRRAREGSSAQAASGRPQAFVGEAFGGEVVGIEAVEDGRWHVHLGPRRLVAPLGSGRATAVRTRLESDGVIAHDGTVAPPVQVVVKGLGTPGERR